MKNIQGSICFKPVFCFLNPHMELEVYSEPQKKKKSINFPSRELSKSSKNFCPKRRK